jgi:hypothetical protein
MGDAGWLWEGFDRVAVGAIESWFIVWDIDKRSETQAMRLKIGGDCDEWRGFCAVFFCGFLVLVMADVAIAHNTRAAK